ncbi:Uncharacterised protein [Escherichia coli]|nr:Uncharacterised protein [Escherichia coli]
MVYSLDFKFVLGYNDRFSGCVDNSYRRYTIFDFEERFISPEHNWLSLYSISVLSKFPG